MNIVHIPRRFTTRSWGGTESCVLELSRQLSALGHRCEILCPDALSNKKQESIGGVSVKRFPSFYPLLGLTPEARYQLDLKGGNLFSFGLWKELKRYPNLDLLHLHTGNRIGGIARTVARRRNIPYLVSLHGGLLTVPPEEMTELVRPTRGTFDWGKPLGWWVGSREVIRDADAVVCLNQAEAAAVEAKYPGQRVEVIPNGVEPDRFGGGDGARFRRRHGISEEAFVLLSVGRIDPQKDQKRAVELATELEGTHLVLIGPPTGPGYHEELKDLAREQGVTLIPGLAPDSEELADAYAAADVFLLTSRHEPFGIVVLEAWSAELPVLGTRVGGVATLIQHGSDGFLFDRNDEGIEFLRCLKNDAELRERLGNKGRERTLSEFSWQVVGRTFLRLYEELREQ